MAGRLRQRLPGVQGLAARLRLLPVRRGLVVALVAPGLVACVGPLASPTPAPPVEIVSRAAWGGRPAAAGGATGASVPATTGDSTRASATAPTTAATNASANATALPTAPSVRVPTAPRPHRIARLTVHHQGVVWQADADVAAYLRRLQTWSRQARGWADLPYHFVVAPDGRVYEGRPVAMAGDTQTEYDPAGHLGVMLLGNFELQQPTPAQWNATVALLAQLTRTHGLDDRALGMHRQFSARTVCPGAHLAERFDALRRAVSARAQAPERAGP